MKLIFAVMLTVLATSADARSAQPGLSKTVAWYVDRIAKENTLEIWVPTCTDEPPEQFERYRHLGQFARTRELISLTDHPNEVVRCYAFLVLAHRDDVDLLPILLQHLDDTLTIRTQFGCVGMSERTGDAMIEMVTSKRYGWGCRALDSLQSAQLDSVLVFVPNRLDARERVLTCLEPHEDWYWRIRELVTQEHYGAALIALARFKKTQDIELILGFQDTDYPYWNLAHWSAPTADTCRQYAYRAIEQFPHPDFLSLLAHRLDNQPNRKRTCGFENREWLRAVATSESAEAAAILTTYCRDTASDGKLIYRPDFVWMLNALKDHLVPPFEGLLWGLWEDHLMTTPEVLAHLSEQDSARAFRASVLCLQHPNDFHDATSRLFYCQESTLFAATWSLIRGRDQAVAREMLRQCIKTGEVLIYSSLSVQVQQYPDSSYIQPLFDRLATEDNGNTFLEIVKALLSYNDPAIDRRILETRKKNIHLTHGWGGEDLAFLLREHGIHWRRLYE